MPWELRFDRAADQLFRAQAGLRDRLVPMLQLASTGPSPRSRRSDSPTSYAGHPATSPMRCSPTAAVIAAVTDLPHASHLGTWSSESGRAQRPGIAC
jgi:hypothetical protein